MTVCVHVCMYVCACLNVCVCVLFLYFSLGLLCRRGSIVIGVRRSGQRATLTLLQPPAGAI